MQKIKNKILQIAIEIDKLIKTSSTGKIEKSQNSSGEVQAKLDVLSDILVEKKLKELNSSPLKKGIIGEFGGVKQIVSEEKEGIVEVNSSGKYLIAYDPLDGSSLIDVNLSVGTIFGIYKQDFNGKNLVASAYIVYGPRVEVVFADNSGVSFFRPHPNPLLKREGTFEEIEIEILEEKGKILSPGAQNNLWPEYHKNIINKFWEEGYKLRYSGGMVPDLHQILLKGGGLFCYPETIDNPNGKLRKLFEVFPFAFIFEKMGGFAIDKNGTRILDLGYEDLHESSSCYFGGKFEINLCRDVLIKHL